MQGRELKTLKLPQLVEARRNQELDMSQVSPSSTGHTHHSSRSSTLSDGPSPTTPTFSMRGHSRLPSSTSSLASSPALRESLDGYGTGHRPLTDVKEEPHDKEEDQQMINGFEDPLHREEEAPPKTPEPQWALTSLEYSYAGDFPVDSLDSDFSASPRAKRRRDEDSPVSPIDGIKSRMPSLSRSLSMKWRSRKGSPTIAMPDRSQEQSLSRANSTRAPSLAGSALEEPKGVQLPPTPARTAFEDSFEDLYDNTIDTRKANSSREDVVDHEAKPTTPLLPPILTQFPDHIREVPYQSPLQSPTVAEPEATSVLNTPLPTPRIAGLPSPPLSSKPSISSFQHQRGPGHISPSSEIPPMLITDPNDRWANELGHANFTINPVPYTPEEFNPATYKQLNADWNVARFNYLQHRMGISEHYGDTSKIYRLTEEKWTEIDAKWKTNVDLCRSHVEEIARQDARLSDPVTKIPSLDGPKSQGKFPTIGDEGIVGPMEQLPSMAQPLRKKRKMGFTRWRDWMQGVWPAGAGVLGRRSPSGP
ncbi:hypothetical protein JMJ35_003389 [Cladonia borealis]|uniref:Only prolin and serin are matching in the corresponding protein n=1 Tax=Cladonia borealis TaxID=184061 RepID=A0AA39R4L1_9LECA|nr:hypothetical protein JMJ35_003389 [Cladonia borealis]